ncbi:MAG: SUMF1/EgtB/PvdO family nonheme iron enzyme [Verrucomicrobia bacterium]|nr:SUMF1/EgtB/PvdO family nonheme iron enzyme [Verrucomicrobiota bacterium]MBU4291002.1 SUMF1/EgtB/PvdO family nonheme iron enzyme [Verrucomicrobiota bacterium]MBU4428643.1 SUMF1/EgtB/PvdO family nonheme iron enzyme [Verrucomicrobiota bacterium]MCG2680873.1 SUMF1/EgtB/PvdO family nonheme iron enzyme [Kiritimatiellia bacterium]
MIIITKPTCPLRRMVGIAALLVCLFISEQGLANNIAVSGVKRLGQEPGSHWLVQFNVSWTNSWRCDLIGAGQSEPYNYDAAWMFMKWRTNDPAAGVTSVWYHASLSTNAADHMAPAGSTIAVGLSGGRSAWGTNGMGVFIYRSTNGSGTFAANRVRLRWNYPVDGVADNAKVELKVSAIELVYVSSGAFYVGSTNGTEAGRFHDGTSSNMPFLIQTEGQISVSNQPNCLWGTGTNVSLDDIGPEGVLSNAYPKGFDAFYGMKYEISQGQYVDFLNTLTAAQANPRWYKVATPTADRNAITNVAGVYTSSLPYVACRDLNWGDLAAYLDWAGLRPLTELEYEKACRGTNAPVAGEYAWGTVTIVKATSITNAGQANEAPLPATANCGGGLMLRVGSLGIGTGTRTNSGAGYYGMMELSGIVNERIVTVGNAEGRSFTGEHGDGMLTTPGGDANVAGWPAATGAGYRGGCADYNNNAYFRAADRTYATCPWSRANLRGVGGRGGRAAP